MPLFLLGAAILRWLTRIGAAITSTKLGAWIAAGLALHAGSMVVKVLKFAGVAVVASKLAAPAILDYIIAPMMGLPPDWQAFLAMAKADEAAAVIVTAVAMRVSERVSLRKRQDAIWQPL